MIRLLLGLLFCCCLSACAFFFKAGRQDHRGQPFERSCSRLCHRAGRALVLVFALYIGVGFNPDSGFSRYVESSPIYSQSSAVFEPLAGEGSGASFRC
jgi:hypothetical protein